MKKRLFLLTLVSIIMSSGTVHAELNSEEIQKLDAYYTLASNYINKGDYEKAEEYVDACFDYCSEETVSEELLADLYLKKGCIATINGDNEAALSHLDTAIQYQSDLADAYLVEIQIYLDQQEYDPAIETIQKYMDLTGEQDMNGTLAQIYELKGDLEKATETYDTYVKANGVSGEEAAFDNALYQMEIGLYDKAIENFEACMENEEYKQAAVYNRLICLMDKGEYKEAEEGFAEGIKAEWGYDGIYFNLGVCQMMQEQYDAALETFKTSQEQESFKEESSRNIALCLMSQDKVEEAIEELTKLIESESVLADEARTYRSNCYASQEKYEEALADLTACIENGYSLSQSYYQRAQVYKLMEDEEKFIEDLENSVNPAK